MTVVWFLSNNSVTSEANHLKCKTLMQGSWAYKTPNNCRNRSKGSPLQGDSLPKKWKFLPFWGPHSHPVHRMAGNFARPSRPTCPSAVPNFTWIGAMSRPCGAKMLIFGLWVNLTPAVCRFTAIPLVIICIYYDMTVAHQYSTLKNEKSHTRTHTHTHAQYRTQFKQSVHNLIHNLTSQYNSLYVSTCGDKCLRWLCDIQLMGALDRLGK